MDAAEQLFRSLDREVWAVTTGTPRTPAGLLATWVMQASLDPQRPVLLVGIAPNHHTASQIQRHGWLAAHLLRTDQAPLGLQLASRSGHDTNKLADVALQPADVSLDCPVLADCHSWAAGPVFARLDAGDRIFYWVEITAADHQGGAGPLRQSQLLAAADDPTRQRLRDDLNRDIELHRPLHAAWRRQLPELLRPPN